VKPQTTATSYRLVVEDVPGALTVVRNADGDEVVVSLGTLLDDVLAPAASNQASIYYGFAGDDAITGGGNNDSIYGGAGKDTINGGAGIDQIDGAGGNDTFVFFSASELEEDASVIGGDDIDTIRMDTGSSALSLSDADFANVSQMERLELNGTGSQTATLGTHASAAFVSSITIMTQAMATSLNLLGGASSVRIDATGTDNADTLIGGDGNDTLSGGNGDDWIDYGGGDNLVFGGDGDDYIDSTDVLGGADTIYGGDGNDLIYASAGDDHIIGGAGNDTLHGEAGVDTFVFEASGLANGTDRIVDYQTGSGGDRSDFSLFFDDEGSAFSASDFAVQGANGTGLVATGKVVQLWSGASNAVTDVDSAQDILDAFQNSVLVLAAGGKSVVISGEDTSAQAGYVWFADDTNGNGLELSEISLVATFDPIFLARFEQSSIIV
jgi:Ca2+-binding RTX toxin-like protein